MAGKVFPVYLVARVSQVKLVSKAKVATSDPKVPVASQVESELPAMRDYKDQPVPPVGQANAASVAKRA